MADRETVMRACARFFGHPPKRARERLTEIAAEAGADEYPDRYGGGVLLESFEREIAALLGKEDAVFMPSGTMAQQIALRIHAGRSGSRNVALHPQSHLLLSENGAMQHLHGLLPVPLGERHRLFTRADLDAVADPLAALLVELPERNIGGALRPWPEVLAIASWARERGVALHLDGARLWESQPYYGMPLAAIAEPFETLYVSFYKILNAVAGAALAGPADIVKEARAWQWRHGGRLVQQYPMVLSARAGMRAYLPRVPLYCERARAIAAVLSSLQGVRITPEPPAANMMHVFVTGERERLEAASLRVSEEHGVWMPASWNATDVPGVQMFELTCGEGALHISDEEARVLFTRLLHLAESR